MDKILFSELIRIETSTTPALYPFCDEFDKDLTKILDRIIEDRYPKCVVFDPPAIETIEALLVFNKTFVQLKGELTKTIQTLNVEQALLIEMLIEFANDSFLEASNVTLQDRPTGVGHTVGNISDKMESPLRNRNGEMVSLSDVSDDIADTCIELIHFVSKLSYTTNNTPGADSLSTQTGLLQLYGLGSQLYTYKNTFEIYQYDFAAIKKEGSLIKIKYHTENYHFIKYAGRIREHSGITEMLAFDHNYAQEEVNVPAVHICNGEVFLSKGEKSFRSAGDNFALMNFISTIFTFT